MREAMMVFCMRCGGFYDMDFEESWEDHHEAPDGTECAPTDCVIDMIGICHQDHTKDWRVLEVTVEVD